MTTTVVVYFGTDAVTPTARVFVALDYLGLGDRARILDGGLPAWRAAKQPVSAEAPSVAPGHLTPHPHADAIVSADWVRAHLHDPKVSIVDAADARLLLGRRARPLPAAGPHRRRPQRAVRLGGRHGQPPAPRRRPRGDPAERRRQTGQRCRDLLPHRPAGERESTSSRARSATGCTSTTARSKNGRRGPICRSRRASAEAALARPRRRT